jgi:LCP family protein required for cell wall assembly
VSDPRDWRDGEPSDAPTSQGRPPEVDLSQRRPFPPRPDGGVPRATEAYRSSLPPRRPATPVLPPPPSRGRGFARVLSWIAVITSVAVLGVSGAGYVLVNHYDGQIDRLPGVFSQEDRPEPTDSSAKNFLIVGSDSRGDLAAGEGVQGTGDNFVSGQRADTVILAHLYGGRSKQAQMVSFPRDSYVDIPAFTDPDTGKTVPAHKGKLNSAFFEGGPRLLTQTIEQLSDVRIDHYLQIDFDGFKSMVDELGGVEVCLPKAAKEKDSGIDLPAGRSVVQGDQALAFVRQRKKLPNGDIDRIARQQQFIGAIIRKVLSSGTLLNPFRLNGFLDAATASLQVDEDLGIGDLRTLAVRLRSFSAGGVSFVTVPITSINGSRKNRDGLFESVVVLDEVKTAQLFQALREDRPPGAPAPAPTASPAPRLIVAPANIRVRVYNGSDVTGLGRKAATELAEVGFRVVGAAASRPGTASTTVVLHGPDKADSARTVAAAIPGATTQLQADLGGTLEVVVGSTYTGAKAVTVTGAPATPSSPRASATPKVVTAAEDPCAV